jgi:hypothetical protein
MRQTLVNLNGFTFAEDTALITLKSMSVPMNQPDYDTATADILTAATLAKPEARKAAVKAVLQSYFPATVEGPSLGVHAQFHQGTVLIVHSDGAVEEWEGTTYRARWQDLQHYVDDCKRRVKP